MAGLGALVLLAAAYWLTHQPAPRVRVLWAPHVVPGQQAALERRYSLLNPRDRMESGSLAYDLVDTSAANIRAIVQDPAVADTNDIDRNTFTIPSDADSGGEWMWLAHRTPGFRDARLRAAIIAILALMVVGGLAADAVRVWRALRRAAAIPVVSTLAFAGVTAAVAILLGPRDLEAYEHAFFSLERGTAVESVRVVGQPVFTLALGIGVRLPLQGALGASPAAWLAPYLPGPLTYWLLMAASIAAAALVVRRALEPLGGARASWFALVLLFWSVPIVDYTVHNDWAETAATYCAGVACVFAPHALLALLDGARSTASRRMAAASLGATVWSLIVLSHAGHWPILAAGLASSSLLAMLRSEYPWHTRVTAVMVLAVASVTAVVPQAPDIVRELQAATAGGSAELTRFIQGSRGENLLATNLFPLEPSVPRVPFTYLFLALVSVSICLSSRSPHLRRLSVGSTLLSVMFGLAATTLPAVQAPYAPSFVWLLRDPAAALAVLSAACGARAAATAPWTHPLIRRTAIAALVAAGLQGPAMAAVPLLRGFPDVFDHNAWTHAIDAPEERMSRRGLPLDRFPPGARLALWPGVRNGMRNAREPSTDLADAGYLVVSAWTKQRTMRAVIEPNNELFNQVVELSADVLCDADAVRFLQLRYLLRSSNQAGCAPWAQVPTLQLDGWLDLDVAPETDTRIRALPGARLTEPLARAPALSARSALLPALVPLEGTSVVLASPDIALSLNEPSVAREHALVLPVAYDAAWRASSGQVREIGGLLALVGVDQHQVVLTFVPDVVALLRALSMTLGQVLATAGMVGLARAATRPLD